MMEKFAVLKKDKNSYDSTDVVSNDDYLDFITNVFTDRLSFARDILEILKSPTGRGMAGNEIRIEVEGQQITISYLYIDDEYIVIDRQELIKILEKGISLMEAKADFIALFRETENSPIEVLDQPPQGMQFFVENLQLKASYKGKIYT